MDSLSGDKIKADSFESAFFMNIAIDSSLCGKQVFYTHLHS